MKRSKNLLLAAAMACAAMLDSCGAPEPAVDSGGSLVSTEGRIAFTRATSFEAPNFESEIYAVNVDGTRERRLTNSPGLDAFPAWSPDGERIIFTSDRDGNWELYLMDADSTGQRRLTRTPEEDEAVPAFSPDGERIAYVTDPVGDSPSIHVMDVAGTNRKRLADGNWPSWSPDGKEISYTVYGADFDIYLMKADGSNPRRLTGRGSNEEGAFSPDGERIAFSSERGGLLRGEDAEIYVMNADGSDQTRLTDIPGNDHWPPTWSPDGSRIAFTSDGPQGSDIYAMNADGSGLTKVTGGPANAAFPAWQPQETIRNGEEEASQ